MSNPSPKRKESRDEAIVKKKSIPAQITLWVVILVLLFFAYEGIAHLSGS